MGRVRLGNVLTSPMAKVPLPALWPTGDRVMRHCAEIERVIGEA